MAKKYPYQDKLLRSLKGEVWQDVLRFENLYQVSNQGRIKSLDRKVNHKSGKLILVRSRIISQTIYRYANKHGKDFAIALRVAFSVDGVRYDFQVRRLVYQAFVGSLDPSMSVINLDGDGFNNSRRNLKIVTNRERQKRSISKGRQVPSLIYLDRSKFRKIGGGYSRRKPIGQYSMAGHHINSYRSIAEASRSTGIADKSIINVAKGRWSHSHKYVWKYE